MTEDEAKTKWCPFARVASLHEGKNPREWIGVTAANRAATDKVVEAKGLGEDGLPLSARCIGSACMAWRRQRVMIDRMTGEPAIPGQAALGDLEERYSAHGYCGLAGQP